MQLYHAAHRPYMHSWFCASRYTFVVAHRPYNICCSTQAIQHLVAHRPYEDCSTQAIQCHVARRPYIIRRTVLAPYSPPRLVTHRSHQDDLVTHRSHTGTVGPPGDHVQTCLMWHHHDATMHGFWFAIYALTQEPYSPPRLVTHRSHTASVQKKDAPSRPCGIHFSERAHFVRYGVHVASICTQIFPERCGIHISICPTHFFWRQRVHIVATSKN